MSFGKEGLTAGAAALQESLEGTDPMSEASPKHPQRGGGGRRSISPPKQKLRGPVVPFTFFWVVGSLIKSNQPQKRVPLS